MVGDWYPTDGAAAIADITTRILPKPTSFGPRGLETVIHLIDSNTISTSELPPRRTEPDHPVLLRIRHIWGPSGEKTPFALTDTTPVGMSIMRCVSASRSTNWS